MKPQDISVGHVYYVDFNPVRRGEFDRNHLAVVLKKNHDRITFIVIPLTSKSSGVGINKVDLGVLACLPPHLRKKNSYAVVNQVRTLNSNRFKELTENGKIYDAILPDSTMEKLYDAIIDDLIQDAPETLKNKYGKT